MIWIAVAIVIFGLAIYSGLTNLAAALTKVEKYKESSTVPEACKENGDSFPYEAELSRSAEEYGDYLNRKYGVPSLSHKDAFIAGANWRKWRMLKSAVDAHCFESFNPVSESDGHSPHVIKVYYDEKEDTPHVVSGDDIKLFIIKEKR